MAIHLDPRRLGLLKQLATDENARPGELVTRWIEERLDAERSGVAIAARPTEAPISDELEALTQRVDVLARRLDELSAKRAPALIAQQAAAAQTGADTSDEAASAPVAKRRGRSRKDQSRPSRAAARGHSKRVALHDEIIAIIGESGPMTAAQIAQAIVVRGRYSAPRSGKPLDAAMVNGRVSNPTYRSRFRRDNGKIALAQ